MRDDPDDDDLWTAEYWAVVAADWEKEQEERFALSTKIIVRAFEEVGREVGHGSAWQLFHAFVQSSHYRPKRQKKKKGEHDPERNRSLLTAYRAASKGKKRILVEEIAQKEGLTPESVERQIRRLLKKHKPRDADAVWDEVCGMSPEKGDK
jgi:hypothetical protein